MKKKTWKVSENVEKAKKVYEKAFKEWKSNGMQKYESDETYAKYTSAKRSLQNIQREERNAEFSDINEKLMNCYSKDRKKVYAMMKSYRQKRSTLCTSRLETPVGTFYGSDILEGFASDAEYLGRSEGENLNYDNDFYRICVLDNFHTFQMKNDSDMRIPKMTITQLNTIIDSQMKKGKSCDIYQMTKEHLKYAGPDIRHHVLNLVNDVIDNIYFLSCPQAKVGLGTAIHKSKNKAVYLSSSYRRVTVMPIIGTIL